MAEPGRLPEGRPSKFTPERAQAVLLALEGGCTRHAAAGAADVHYSTLVRWIGEHAEFRAEVEKAEDRAEARFTAAVLQAVPDNWQAAAWWLERRKHQDYARRDRVDMQIEVRREVERIAAETGLDSEALIAEAERILAGQR